MGLTCIVMSAPEWVFQLDVWVSFISSIWENRCVVVGHRQYAFHCCRIIPDEGYPHFSHIYLICNVNRTTGQQLHYRFPQFSSHIFSSHICQMSSHIYHEFAHFSYEFVHFPNEFAHFSYEFVHFSFHFVHMNVPLSVWLSVCLSVCLSIRLASILTNSAQGRKYWI